MGRQLRRRALRGGNARARLRRRERYGGGSKLT